MVIWLANFLPRRMDLFTFYVFILVVSLLKIRYILYKVKRKSIFYLMFSETILFEEHVFEILLKNSQN